MPNRGVGGACPRLHGEHPGRRHAPQRPIAAPHRYRLGPPLAAWFSPAGHKGDRQPDLTTSIFFLFLVAGLT